MDQPAPADQPPGNSPSASAPPTEPVPPSGAPQPPQSWARTALWLGVTVILAVNVTILLRSCRDLPGDVIDKTGRTIEKAGRALSEVAAAFNQGRITTEFISYATTLSPERRLQFARLRQMEVFTRKEEASTGFGHVPLPDVIVEARAPVQFTYTLNLNAPWQILVQDDVVHVRAPRIEFNDPAVDVSALQYEVRKNSVFRNTTAAMDGLKQSITSLSRQRARENIHLVRETGRRQTAEFVETWLGRTYSDGQRHPVRVYFADEPWPAEAGTGTGPQVLIGTNGKVEALKR